MGSWLIPYTTHYNQVFIDTTKDLLAMLGHSRDYHRVIEYASRALSLEPGIQDAYYWISIAAEATGNSMMKDWYDQMARDELPEEEYQKVQHLLEIRTHKEEYSLYAGGSSPSFFISFLSQDWFLNRFPRTALKTERYFCCSEARQTIQ